MADGTPKEEASGDGRLTSGADKFWDNPFHSIALYAYVHTARKEGKWPEPEPTRRLASALFENRHKDNLDEVIAETYKSTQSVV